MPSSWLEEGEQFHHGHEHANDTAYSNEARNPRDTAESPAQFGSRQYPQTTFAAQLPNNCGTFATNSPYSWGSSNPITPISQERMRSMIVAQYPDDIDRSRWNETRPPNELDYSPAFSDSPLIHSSAARQPRSSDINSLFEDSGSEEEIYVLQACPAEDAEDIPANAVLNHGHDIDHDHDPPSPCGLSRQLQGQLNVFSSEAGVGLEEHEHVPFGYNIHSASDEEAPQSQLPEQGSSYSDEDEDTSYRVSAQTGQLREQQLAEWQEAEARHKKAHNCTCGCSGSECACHPSYCECSGCDHTEQLKQLREDAERRWGDEGYSGNQNCGCGDLQKRCSCLLGLCHCTTCSEHGSEMVVEPVNHCGCGVHGQRCQCRPDRCACVGCDEHATGSEYRQSSTESKIYQKLTVGSQSVADGVPPHTQGWQKLDSSRGHHQTLVAVQAMHICGCTLDGICSCPSGRCGCDKECLGKEKRGLDSQQYLPTQPCLCGEGRVWTCSPGACSCRKAERAPDPETFCREEEPAGSIQASTWAARQDHRPLHLKLAELIENPTPSPIPSTSAPAISRKGSVLPMPAQPPTPAFSQRSSIPPSRPDTPRPPADSTSSTPYAADVLQDYIQQSIERELLPPTQEHIRQSVEPEVPPANWARESTPAYVDRSLTPSPLSRRDTDIKMRDASPTLLPGDLDRALSLPPPTSQPDHSISNNLAAAPVKLAPPPIPDGSSAIKQPKRGERCKSAVQGSKVEKRSATGSMAKPKSRNVTRKPTASVGKLVDKAKKQTKEAAAGVAQAGQGQGQEASNGPPQPTATASNHGGKVAAAVAKIEQQVKQQDEEKTLKQKDGTAVRRSQRANKGVRTSFGYT